MPSAAKQTDNVIDLESYRETKKFDELSDYRRRYAEFEDHYRSLLLDKTLTPEEAYAKAWTMAYAF
jgi:hypothetical protein